MGGSKKGVARREETREWNKEGESRGGHGD